MKDISICAIDGIIHISTEEFEEIVADVKENTIDDFVKHLEKCAALGMVNIKDIYELAYVFKNKSNCCDCEYTYSGEDCDSECLIKRINYAE